MKASTLKKYLKDVPDDAEIMINVHNEKLGYVNFYAEVAVTQADPENVLLLYPGILDTDHLKKLQAGSH